MYLITVIPIAKAISKESLTYFTSQIVEAGSVVEIPLRSKKAFGIVIRCTLAENKKSEIKKLSYGLKKIDKVQSKQFLLPAFMDATLTIADYYATSTGAVLSALIPKTILESLDTIPLQKEQGEKEIKNDEKKSNGEILVLQSDNEERYGAYKSFIREEFAKKKSVYLTLPSREEIRSIRLILEKGIEPYTYILHNGLSKREIIETWKKILENEHPILIIATGYFLSIPRHDLGSIIVEFESSRSYSQPTRPFLDIRMVTEIMAKKMNKKLILGDRCVRIETLFREKENEIVEFSKLKFRVLTSAECLLVDTRVAKNQTKKEFETIGSDLSQLIEETKKTNDQLFLFSARKGLFPLTVCADCGEVFCCPNCRAPMILYGLTKKSPKDGNFFLCHTCGEKVTSDTLCTRCGSWKLTPLGIGIEFVEKELKKKFPDLAIFIMDKDHITTHKQAVKLIAQFYDTPGSVMLGTEMVLPYLKEKIAHTGVVTLDSFFSIPDFKMNEKIMNIILSLRSLAFKKVLVQTRRPEENIFDYALKGNLADFYRDEIEVRKRFGYPPFNTFIKISLEGNKIETRVHMEKLKQDLKPYDLNIFEAFHSGTQKKYVIHGLIMLPRGKWSFGNTQDRVDHILLEKLRALPPQFSVKVDPDTLL